MNRWPFDPEAQVLDDIAVAWDDPDYPAAGGATVTGTAAGAATSSGTAAGTRTVLGTAAGAATSTGTAAGTKTVFGTAAGEATSSGTATGTVETSGIEPELAPAGPPRGFRREPPPQHIRRSHRLEIVILATNVVTVDGVSKHTAPMPARSHHATRSHVTRSRHRKTVRSTHRNTGSSCVDRPYTRRRIERDDEDVILAFLSEGGPNP